IGVTDPAAAAGGAATVTALVTTTSGQPTQVTLAKSATIPDVYTGQIGIGLPGSAGTATSIPGANGDTITIGYPDFNGITATATVDNVPPTVDQVANTDITPFGVSIDSRT